MNSNNQLAEKARLSADKMEIMNVEMHDIAQKTGVETVSMRIITVVTLFFLPGTFISVSDYSYDSSSTLTGDRHS